MRFVLSRRMADLAVDHWRWDALVAEMPNATVFQTYEWFECWWKAFGNQHELFLITLWDGQTLVGIAPLMLVQRFRLRQIEFIGSSNADYQDFILGKRNVDLLPLLVRYLYEQRDAWDMLVLRNVPTDSPTFAILPAMMRSFGLGSTDHERVACPTIEISSRPVEIRRLLDGYSWRRRIKRMKRHGELNYMRCSTVEQVDHYLPQFFEQYVERRRDSVAAEIFLRPEVRAFFATLAKSMLPRGWLHFSVLECAGRPVAFHFGFEFGGRLYWYKPSFDPKVARLSPGTVLLWHLVRDSLESGLTELDFTVGAEPFKYRYANTQRTNANLRVFSRRWLPLIAMCVIGLRRIAGRFRRVLSGRPTQVSPARSTQRLRASPIVDERM